MRICQGMPISLHGIYVMMRGLNSIALQPASNKHRTDSYLEATSAMVAFDIWAKAPSNNMNHMDLAGYVLRQESVTCCFRV